jgi:nitrite reductase (NADH) large subunit
MVDADKMTQRTRKRLLIVGNGMATESLLKALGSNHHWDIQVLGDEPVPYYNRIMLSPLLGNEVDLESITPLSQDWYQDRRVSVVTGKRVVRVEANEKRVLCGNGDRPVYDKLVIATGSSAALPPLARAGQLSGVTGFRSLADVEQLRHWCREHPGEPAVVIGGGLLGVEAAVGLARLGAEVTLVHRRPVLMNRQLDAFASGLLQAALNERGIHVCTQTSPVALQGEDHVTGVRVARGEDEHLLRAGLVVCATGIRPNTELVRDTDVQCERAIVVDERLRTSNPDIYSLGECCQFNGNTYGLVAPVQEQARVLGKTLRGEAAAYREKRFVTRLKVSGLDIHSMGDIEAGEGQDVLWLGDARDGLYKKLILENNRLRGALLVGDVRHSQHYFELLCRGTDVESSRDELLFDPEPSIQTSQTADLPADVA